MGIYRIAKLKLNNEVYRFTHDGKKTLLEIYDNEGYLQAELTTEKSEQEWQYINRLERFIALNQAKVVYIENLSL